MCELHEKVDYMILDQQYVLNGSNIVDKYDNPNYPIIYADVICRAIDSGIFDVVVNPHSFLKYRDSITTDLGKKEFDQNATLACHIICDKTRDMGIPIEFRFEEGTNLLDSFLITAIKDTDGLMIICDDEYVDLLDDINSKIIKDGYNPKLTREKNIKLQSAYLRTYNSCLTYETYMIGDVLRKSLSDIEENSAEEIMQALGNSFRNASKESMINAKNKDNQLLDDISKLASCNQLDTKSKKELIERKRKTITETDKVLNNLNEAFEIARRNAVIAMELGCTTKEEFINIIMQLTEYNTTLNPNSKKKVQSHMTEFRQVKSGESILDLNNKLILRDPNGGFASILVIMSIIAFIIGILLGIVVAIN